MPKAINKGSTKCQDMLTENSVNTRIQISFQHFFPHLDPWERLSPCLVTGVWPPFPSPRSDFSCSKYTLRIFNLWRNCVHGDKNQSIWKFGTCLSYSLHVCYHPYSRKLTLHKMAVQISGNLKSGLISILTLRKQLIFHFIYLFSYFNSNSNF